jgi:GDP-L-fucose synthase
MRRLEREECKILTVPHSALDLTRQADTEEWMVASRPDAVILAAAKVGGIYANAAAPADFAYTNLAIAQNVIHSSYTLGVKKLLFLGSSCIYPRLAAQPMSEDALLTGPLEPTNEAYAVAKIAGIKLCQYYRRQYGCDFISCMPTNLYGPGDTYDLESSHVIPALIMRFHRARVEGVKTLEIRGSGTALREFLFVDDLADALVFLMTRYSSDMPVNVGTGRETSIAALAAMIADVTGFKGDITFNPAFADGAPRKVLDVSRLNDMGWGAKTPLSEGLRITYAAYREGLGEAACAA